MNLRMGNQVFMNVQIPLLWGERAILEDERHRISVLDLSGENACVELLADEPAPGVSFRPRVDGFVFLKDGVELYSYNPREKAISSIALGLPDVQIGASGTRIGGSLFSGNVVTGSPVGVAVSERGIAIGAPLPQKLARLTLRRAS